MHLLSFTKNNRVCEALWSVNNCFKWMKYMSVILDFKAVLHFSLLNCLGCKIYNCNLWKFMCIMQYYLWSSTMISLPVFPGTFSVSVLLISLVSLLGTKVSKSLKMALNPTKRMREYRKQCFTVMLTNVLLYKAIISYGMLH